MLESLVIVILLVAFIFFILALYDERTYYKIVCSGISTLMWIILMPGFIGIEIAGQSDTYTYSALSMLAFGFIMINVIHMIYGFIMAFAEFKTATNENEGPPHLRLR